jgi:broad specificity phosphatase PhoE
MRTLFITHPNVEIDEDLPVPRWRLSDHGVARMRTFVASPSVSNVAEVWASTETKAIEAAGLLAARFGLPIHVHAGLNENDRSATGFLPPAEFEAVADAFFGAPFENIRGWETAMAAQSRVAGTVNAILSRRPPSGDLAIVAHGAVGTLLLCEYLGLPISRTKDQPFQGHYWSFDPSTRAVLHEWKPIAPP